MLVLLVVSTLAFAFRTQPVEASGTIYIRVDGSRASTNSTNTTKRRPLYLDG